MKYTYPTPQDVGIEIAPHLMKDRFCRGFEHALKGRQISRVEHLRQSFREGYRAGKLYLRELRREQGIVEFPMKARMKFRLA